MRILAIRGKNLASLEGEFEVDFTTEPLRSAGIFAITGSTGSGKSTLLDAICLALFNETPRINRAENAYIVDVGNETINQKDSRNILRRGTIDGYAEVDFVALSGERYRARWSVRRSRDRVGGALQAATYKVINLTTNEELQGVKTELLNKVKELLGLTFVQFTRAVLLAQGDFATFLKADRNEKAELLEKLTGTDIYSRVSTKIYQNTREAEAALAEIKARISGIELLSDEKIIELNTEKESTAKEVEVLDAELKVAQEKLTWLQRHTELVSNIQLAQRDLEANKTSIDLAAPRFDYLARVESVQEIRDHYMQLERDKMQLSADEMSLKDQQALSATNTQQATEAQEKLTALQQVLQQLETEWQIKGPQVIEARALDVKIVGGDTNLAEINNQVLQIEGQKQACEKSKIDSEKRINDIRQSQSEAQNWFEAHSRYNAIIPQIALICQYITNGQNQSAEVLHNEQLLKLNTELLNKESKELSVQQEEAKKLNDILPAEIAALRDKLQENEPCPVCGSTHHPISNIAVDILEEEELNEKKSKVYKEIERLSVSISTRNNELIRLQSFIDTFNGQYQSTLATLDELLSSIEGWQESYELKTLSDELRAVEQKWNSTLQEQTSLSEQLTTQNQALTTAQERLVEITASLKETQNKQAVVSALLAQLRTQRNELLEGKSADEVEGFYLEEQRKVSRQLTQAREQTNQIIAQGEHIKGSITALFASTSRLQSSIAELEKTLSVWLQAREDHLTITALQELLSKDINWIGVERNALKTLSDQQLACQTTLDERLRVEKEHQQAKIKAGADDREEIMNEQITEKTGYVRTKRDRITEIGVLFENHENGENRIMQFEKERAEKDIAYENWSKLNELLGSANGDKFKVLAQGYTLDVLLDYANKHLSDISQRYVLERISSDSLSLQVVDLDMLSEVRSVHSLSGGESFLISLALALGLSSLSSNRMRIESLFIDEGFGSLDADTLRIAMDALERLQTQGRKIGVISHVAEMTERISTQIRVNKTTSGRSTIEISGV